MKTTWVNPFVESVYSLCSTMLNCRVERGQLGPSTAKSATGGDITGLIGLSGMARGMVALSFPTTTARAMVGRLLSLSDGEVDDSVSDGVAELVNIVAGSAKAKFSDGDGSEIISLGLPTVIRGGSQIVECPSRSSWLDVPFASDLGPIQPTHHVRAGTSQGGQLMKALVVDDSAVMRKVMIGALARAGIEDVAQAADGQEAVAACNADDFSLVLLDWNMPNMLGIDALKAIRANGKTVPVIMVTTEAEKCSGDRGAQGRREQLCDQAVRTRGDRHEDPGDARQGGVTHDRAPRPRSRRGGARARRSPTPRGRLRRRARP